MAPALMISSGYGRLVPVHGLFRSPDKWRDR